MKKIPRWLELQAEIDYLHFELGNIYRDSKRPRQPIELLIDKATGYDKKRLDEAQALIDKIEELKKEFYLL